MSGKPTNIDNSHPFFGSSDQGMLTGCAGGAVDAAGNCTGVVQARGIVGSQTGGYNGVPGINYPTAESQQKAADKGLADYKSAVTGGFSQAGGGAGFTNENIITSPNARAPVTSYSNCKGQSPKFKMGAGQPYSSDAAMMKRAQTGGGRNPLAPTASDYYNQSTSVGYGYINGKDNLLFAGSGYPKETQTTTMNSCQKGGKRRRTRHPKKGKRSRTRKGKRDFLTHKGDKLFNRRGHRQKRPNKRSRKRRPYKKRRRKSRKQRGGYSQYQSDVPLTYTMQTPNGSQGGSWEGQLATPPTYKVLNLCQDNYNHYTQK